MELSYKWHVLSTQIMSIYRFMECVSIQNKWCREKKSVEVVYLFTTGAMDRPHGMTLYRWGPQSYGACGYFWNVENRYHNKMAAKDDALLHKVLCLPKLLLQPLKITFPDHRPVKLPHPKLMAKG